MATASPSGQRVGAAGPAAPLDSDGVRDPLDLDFTATAPGPGDLPIVVARPRAGTLRNRAVLVVDADTGEGHRTAEALATLGLHAVAESTLHAAARHISIIGAPCLVVLELEIPRALDFLSALKRRTQLRDVAVVAYTWRGDREALDAALHAGVDGYVMKAGDPEPLLKAVGRVLQLPRAVDALR